MTPATKKIRCNKAVENKFKVFEIDGSASFDIEKSTSKWVMYKNTHVESTKQRRAQWMKIKELRGLLEKVGKKGSVDASFRTKLSGYYAYDPETNAKYPIDQITVLPGGDLMVSWLFSPKQNVYIEEVEDEEDNENDDEKKMLREEIEELKKKLEEKIRTEDGYKKEIESLEYDKSRLFDVLEENNNRYEYFEGQQPAINVIANPEVEPKEEEEDIFIKKED